MLLTGIIFKALDATRLGKGDFVKVFDGAVQDDSKLLAEYRAETDGNSFVVTTGPTAVVLFEAKDTPGGGFNFGYIEG